MSTLYDGQGNTIEVGGGSVITFSEEKNDFEKAYAYPAYEKNKRIDENGNVIAGGSGTSNNQWVSELLPVVPGETLTLNGSLVINVAYYDEDGAFISPRISPSAGVNDYTVPDTAKYARFANNYTRGPARPLYVRRKAQPTVDSFADAVWSPLHAETELGFTGDSNTYGYSSGGQIASWANLFIAALESWTDFYYGTTSKWVECIGMYGSGEYVEANADSEFSIWTDAESVTLCWNTNLSGSPSSWKWLVDGVESGTASSTTLSLNGDLHKVTVHFLGGRMQGPYFSITKSIVCENAAHSGAHFHDVEIPYKYVATADETKQSSKQYYSRSGSAPCYKYGEYDDDWVSGTTYYERVGLKDWLLVMIGTNDRGDVTSGGSETPWLPASFLKYYGRGTYIVPFPVHNSSAGEGRLQMNAFSNIADRFAASGYDILNLSAEVTGPFYTDALYQADKLHFSETGHRYLANYISGKLGLPLYLKEVT